MQRRIVPTVFAVALLVVLTVPSSAFALRAHVRVEGKRATIFGATQPLLTPYTGSLPVADSTIDLTQPTALGALEAASERGEFFYELQSFSFGPYVTRSGVTRPRERRAGSTRSTASRRRSERMPTC